MVCNTAHQSFLVEHKLNFWQFGLFCRWLVLKYIFLFSALQATMSHPTTR